MHRMALLRYDTAACLRIAAGWASLAAGAARGGHCGACGRQSEHLGPAQPVTVCHPFLRCADDIPDNIMSLQHLAVGLIIAAGVQPCSAGKTGDVVVGLTFLPGSLDPNDGSSTPWAMTSIGVSEKMYTVDKDGNVVAQLADPSSPPSKVGGSSTLWDVTLASGKKFSDGSAVTTAIVASSLQSLNANAQGGTASLGTATFTAQSANVIRISSAKPTEVMASVLAEWCFTPYKGTGTGTSTSLLFTGPYKIDNYTAGTQIDLLPNLHYDATASTRPVIHVKKMSATEIATAAKADTIDIGFHIPITEVVPVRNAAGQRVASFETGYHTMMFHNTDTLELKVRQAIDKAIDRGALVTAQSGGTATRSVFPDYSPYHLSDAAGSLAGDAAGAAALLDSAGWTCTGTCSAANKRMKAGKTLDVHLVAYPHRPTLGMMQPLIEKSLDDLGINCTATMTGMAWSETSAHMNARTFDLLMWAQLTLPAGDPNWFLHNFFRSDAGSNHANINSSLIDAKLDTLSSAAPGTARIAASKAAETQIQAEVPVSNLVTPFWHVSLSERMRTYTPFGSDYHVVRSDLLVSPPPPPVAAQGQTSGAYRSTICAMVTAAILAVIA